MASTIKSIRPTKATTIPTLRAVIIKATSEINCLKSVMTRRRIVKITPQPLAVLIKGDMTLDYLYYEIASNPHRA